MFSDPYWFLKYRNVSFSVGIKVMIAKMPLCNIRISYFSSLILSQFVWHIDKIYDIFAFLFQVYNFFYLDSRGRCSCGTARKKNFLLNIWSYQSPGKQFMLRTFVLSKSKFRWFFVALTCSTQDQDEICVGMPWSIERSVYNAFVAENVKKRN